MRAPAVPEPLSPPGADAVCVGLVAGDEMLVVRTHRHPDRWQPAGGRCRRGESPLAAAMREVREELGVTVARDDLVEVWSAPLDVADGTLTFFLTDLPRRTRLDVDTAEIAECAWVHLTDLAALPAFPAAAGFFALWARAHRRVSVVID